MISHYETRNTALSAALLRGFAGYPARFHKDLELVYVSSGFLEVSIEGRIWRLEAGDAFAVFPNVTHATLQQNCRKYMILISPELLPEQSQSLLRCKPRQPVLCRDTNAPLLATLFERCAALYEADPTTNRPVLTAHIGSILSELLLFMELEDRGGDTALVQQMMGYVLENYTEAISLEKMAKALGYSRFYLSRLLGETFGCNFRALVNNYRVGMAENLLLTTQKSISAIALECGFQNQSSFNRVFLCVCGMTPRAYRTAGGSEKAAGS